VITHKTEARSNRSGRSMFRQVHHDRLDLPLVLRLVEGCATFKSLKTVTTLKDWVGGWDNNLLNVGLSV
jgi:hypothetical protein